MDRRTLLSLVAAGATGLAGCGSPEGETETETPTPNDGNTAETTTTPVDERVERELSVWNPTPDPVFTTVVVSQGGRDIYFDNVDLVPGERDTTRVTLPPGDVEVLVETDTGIRARSPWTVDGVGDGLEVVLGRDAAEFWGRVACHPSRECSIAERSDIIDLPLVGDGSGRWYAPAGIVVENPGSETTVRLQVDLVETTLLDRRYRIPPQTRLSVPMTYRTGTYSVVLETDEMDTQTTWAVPDEPTKYVNTESGAVGCGPANTTLTVANQDDEPHQLSVQVESESDTFDEVFDLGPGESRDLVPVAESGAKQVVARLETGASVSGMWWSCPPRGPASVVVDATGSIELRAAGPKPG